jgi:hypothetical protein
VIEETEAVATGVSRRAVLGAVGAGAAAVWAAPAISSLATANAGSARPNCDQCAGDICFGQVQCGTTPFGTGDCQCAQRASDNSCFCYNDDFCANRTPCPNGDGDCPSGQTCVHTCCDADVGSPVCWTPCGVDTAGIAQATSGPRGANK